MREPWPVVDRAVEYENDWYRGGYDLVEQPDGSRKRYYWATLPPAVVVVAVHDDHVLFVEQYRPTIREYHLELPAGIVETDETYEEAGARELEEETGFRPIHTELLQEYAVATGVLEHDRGVVFATDLEPGRRELDSNEFLEVRHVPIAEAIDRARTRPANDSTMTALLLADADRRL